MPRRPPVKTAEAYAKEAVEYFANARGLLRSVPIQDDIYQDVKTVREACGTAYLAVLAAIRSFLLAQGVHPGKLPESYEAHGALLARYASRNGKVLKEFHLAYAALHLDGYYRGYSTAEFGKRAFAHGRFVIERLTGRKVDGA